ncbi:NAD(P)-binding protein [Mycena latifolia]|nr:NAD(P)-binding protein [Mycena latifolia]
MPWSSESLSTARAFNTGFAPSYIPVGIFVGGTSGIGKGIAEAFARHTKGNAHIVIVGRNRAAAESIIAGFPKPTMAGVKHEFFECDAKLIKNVQNTATELLVRFPRINFLVLSAGAVSTKPWDESEEGLDRRLAVLYYSRWKFIYDLLPGLRAAKAAGQHTKVMSVGHPGIGGHIDVHDLGLKKNFSLTRVRAEIPTYFDAMIESFAAQEPEMTFIHTYPGTVITGLFTSADSTLIRTFSFLFHGLLYPFSISVETSGECQLYALLRSGLGPERTDASGESIGKKGYHVVEEAKQKLWAHTVEATTV